MNSHPWETGWQPTDDPTAQASCIATKVINETTYHLWQNEGGTEFIQKNDAFYQVSPGAWSTIPPADHLVRKRAQRLGPLGPT